MMNPYFIYTVCWMATVMLCLIRVKYSESPTLLYASLGWLLTSTAMGMWVGSPIAPGWLVAVAITGAQTQPSTRKAIADAVRRATRQRVWKSVNDL
jgi:hypothetical protein